MEWINVNDKFPKLNDEYLVVWDLEDGGHPVVSSMDFDVKRKCFIDPRGTNEPVDGILFWGEYPPPPKLEKQKCVFPQEQIVTSVDQMERLAYGQCVHGENLASCDICNPSN